MSSNSKKLEQKIEAIHAAVKDIPCTIENLHDKVDSLDQKVTQLQIDTGIAQENIKAHPKTHAILSTIIILTITSAIGFAWLVVEKWAQVRSEITAISKDIDTIQTMQTNENGDRFGHRKGPVSLAPGSSPNVDVD